tara:strand:- start:41 stop:304 length:264 start_codon:yes stop_codon:yes gene_type:complete
MQVVVAVVQGKQLRLVLVEMVELVVVEKEEQMHLPQILHGQVTEMEHLELPTLVVEEVVQVHMVEEDLVVLVEVALLLLLIHPFKFN